MKAPQKFQITVFLLALTGAVLMMGLLLRYGARDIAGAVEAAGAGVGLIIAFHNLPLFLDALAWQVLFPSARRPRLGSLFWMRWIGEAISTLLPAAQVGGDIVRARLAATRAAVPLSTAGATVLADITLSIFVQLLFTLSGVVTLAALTHQRGMVGPAIFGSLIAAGCIAVFFIIQRHGMFHVICAIGARLARSASWANVVAQGDALDRDVRAIYARPAALSASSLLTLLSWGAGVVEVWIALAALGVRASYAQSWCFESICQGIRAALFLVPGALGAQEGGYVLVGGLLGIPAHTALALAVIRRVRELFFGLTGTIAWQWIEGRPLWRRSLISRHAA